jgi:hypothetical protein
MTELNVKITTWDDVKNEVKVVNKPLYQIIEQAKPSAERTLFKVKYRYGDLITENGILNLPDSRGLLLPVTSDLVPPDIKNKISYRSIPLFLVLKNSCEVFVDMDTRTVPLNIFYAGSLLGLFETHDLLTDRPSDPIWTVSAGGRSIFMLPSLADNQGVNRLRRHYDFSVKKTPGHLKDHWEFFKGIVNSPRFDQEWSCEILIFSEAWLDTSDPNLFDFQRYLFGNSWIQSQYAMAKVKFSFTWQIFMGAMYQRHLHLRPYLADTTKHLFLIASKEWTGFCPADNTQRVAPTLGLQKAIVDIYQLKNHLPTIMHPTPLADVDQLFPVYYSLSYPTLLEGEPEHGTINRIMPDLREIKMAMDTFFERVTPQQQIKLGAVKDIAFECFHTEDDVYNEIYKSTDILQLDSRFVGLEKEFKNRTFCASSIFWRGCIRISKK